MSHLCRSDALPSSGVDHICLLLRFVVRFPLGVRLEVTLQVWREGDALPAGGGPGGFDAAAAAAAAAASCGVPVQTLLPPERGRICAPVYPDAHARGFSASMRSHASVPVFLNDPNFRFYRGM